MLARMQQLLRRDVVREDRLGRLDQLLRASRLVIATVCVLAFVGPAGAQWTALPSNPLGATSNMILLPNGTILVQGVGTPANNRASNLWSILTPDASGNYATGTWTTIGAMNVQRYNYSSWVTNSGNVVIAGGQYTTVPVGNTNSDIEIFNPVSGTWTQSLASYPGFFLSNSPSAMLPSGAILFGDASTSNCYLYDPSTDTWNATGQKAYAPGSDISEGQTFTLMPNGKVLTWPSWQNFTQPIPSAWSSGTLYVTGSVVVNGGNFYVATNNGTSGNGGGPTGNGNAIPDGPVLVWAYFSAWTPSTVYSTGQYVCANGGTYKCKTGGTSAAGGFGPSTGGNNVADGSAVWSYVSFFNAPAGQTYDPSLGSWLLTAPSSSKLTDIQYDVASQFSMGPATVLPDGTAIQIGANGNTAIYNPTQNKWSVGPTFPAGQGADFSPGALLPNGQFLVAVDAAPGQGAPTRLYTYDYVTKSLSSVVLSGQLATDMQTSGASIRRTLVLPNGHMLLNTGTGRIWDYTPTGNPLNAWRPTVSSVTKNTSTLYTLTGSRLTGISVGAASATPSLVLNTISK